MKINRTRKIELVIGVIVFLLSFWGGIMVSADRTFTPDELAKYNGQNGAASYVAVYGVVYDVTNVPEWAGGVHFCQQALAGKDLTFIWNLAPPSHRKPAFLKRFPVVGSLVAVRPQPSVSSQATGFTPRASMVAPAPVATPRPSLASVPSVRPQPTVAPTPPVPDEASNRKIMMFGLMIALVITLGWLGIRLKWRKRRLK